MERRSGCAKAGRRVAAAGALAALLLGVAAGCSKSTQPAPPASPPPAADSPGNALERLRWSWEHRDTLVYGTLPTADFWYGYLISDTVTNPLGSTPWTRTEELVFARHLFAGGDSSGAPPATSIAFVYQSQPVPQADSRPGKDPTWHQEASTIISVLITCADGSQILIGAPVRFFLVRGDSAALTPEMIAGGALPSANRWYLEGWNELNVQPITTPRYNSFEPLRDRYR